MMKRLKNSFKKENVLKKINLDCEYLYDYIIEGDWYNPKIEVLCNYNHNFGKFLENCEGCSLFDKK